jgi:hypothetical protein
VVPPCGGCAGVIPDRPACGRLCVLRAIPAAAAVALADEHDIYLAMPLFVLDPAGAAAPVN